MTKVADLLEAKGSAVYTVTPEVSVQEAVRQMAERHIGGVLVLEAETVAGIFTERDAMTRVLLKGLDPALTTVGRIMTTDLTCVAPETSVYEAMAIMTEQRCRHLPVMEGGKLAGLVSIGDCTRWVSRDQAFTIKHLTDYVQGNYPR